jgi:hypothetical protein
MLCDPCVLCSEKRGVFINILIYFYVARARSQISRHEPKPWKNLLDRITGSTGCDFSGQSR